MIVTLFIFISLIGLSYQQCDEEAEQYCQHDFGQCSARVVTLGLDPMEKCDCYETWITCLNAGCNQLAHAQMGCADLGCDDSVCLVNDHQHKVFNEHGTSAPPPLADPTWGTVTENSATTAFISFSAVVLSSLMLIA